MLSRSMTYAARSLLIVSVPLLLVACGGGGGPDVSSQSLAPVHAFEATLWSGNVVQQGDQAHSIGLHASGSESEAVLSFSLNEVSGPVNSAHLRIRAEGMVGTPFDYGHFAVQHLTLLDGSLTGVRITMEPGIELSEDRTEWVLDVTEIVQDDIADGRLMTHLFIVLVFDIFLITPEDVLMNIYGSDAFNAENRPELVVTY